MCLDEGEKVGDERLHWFSVCGETFGNETVDGSNLHGFTLEHQNFDLLVGDLIFAAVGCYLPCECLKQLLVVSFLGTTQLSKVFILRQIEKLKICQHLFKAFVHLLLVELFRFSLAIFVKQYHRRSAYLTICLLYLCSNSLVYLQLLVLVASLSFFSFPLLLESLVLVHIPVILHLESLAVVNCTVLLTLVEAIRSRFVFELHHADTVDEFALRRVLNWYISIPV